MDIPTSQCPMCSGMGFLVVSAPAIVYEIFDERATHRLPDWNQKMAQAEAYDKRVRHGLRKAMSKPLDSDRGQGIKMYETEFGRTERDRLREKAQLDNMG